MNSSPSTRLAFAIVPLSLACLAAAAPPRQTYSIALHLAPGDTWSFESNTLVKITTHLIRGGQVADPPDQSVTQRRTGTIQVIGVADGLPSAVKVGFDADSTDDGHPFPLAGKTVTLRSEAGQVVTDLDATVDPRLLAELGRMLAPDTTAYPPAAVAVGQEWDADATQLARQFQLGPQDHVSLRATLVGVSDAKGRQVADITLSGVGVKQQPGGSGQTRITLAGKSRIDLATGLVLNSELTGQARSKGRQVEPNQTLPTTYDATVAYSVKQDDTIMKAGAGGAAGIGVASSPGGVAGAGGIAGAGGVNNAGADPQTQRDAPRAGGGDLQFDGAFRSDQLQLELTSNQSHYTGTLTIADRKYPISAQFEGGRLAGTFGSGGSTFDFTATLAGPTLTLQSGKATYVLSRRPRP